MATTRGLSVRASGDVIMLEGDLELQHTTSSPGPRISYALKALVRTVAAYSVLVSRHIHVTQ